MRYLVGLLLLLLLLLVGSPLSVSAQGSEEGLTPRSSGTEPVQETQPSQSWLERMHPGAFEAPVHEPKSGFEIGYVYAETEARTERKPKRSRGARIAMGVLIPVLAIGIVGGTIGGVLVTNKVLAGL